MSHATDNPGPTDDGASKTAMGAFLEQGIGLARTLLVALVEERRCLEQRTLDALQDAVSRKTAAIRALERHGAQHHELLTTNAIVNLTDHRADPSPGDDLTNQSATPTATPSKTAAVAVLTTAQDQPALIQQRTMFRNLVEQCRQANAVNGAIVNRASQSVRELLRLLDHDPLSRIYGSEGVSQESLTSRSIGEA